MRILVTGSAGHLGEALMRTLRPSQHDVIGLDRLGSPFTDLIASITDRTAIRSAMRGIDAVLHTATLHKPHVATHSPQDFIDTNISGTLNVLEAALAADVSRVVFTSSTSVFGDALVPAEGKPAAWITEGVVPVPKNIYGATKAAAEDLCQLFHRNYGLSCIVLRVSRFFPEEDDAPAVRAAYDDANIKANEFLYRRVAIDDAVSAHLCALERAPTIGFGRYVISAPPPFLPEDCPALRTDAAAVLALRMPGYAEVYAQRGWRMFPSLDRVYSPALARRELHWTPRTDFSTILTRLRDSGEMLSELARQIGAKGYHRAEVRPH
jgi:nucleoside-diphosphate-sugar epimerase